MDTDFSKIVKYLRNSGMSDSEIARRTGCHCATIGRIAEGQQPRYLLGKNLEHLLGAHFRVHRDLEADVALLAMDDPTSVVVQLFGTMAQIIELSGVEDADLDKVLSKQYELALQGKVDRHAAREVFAKFYCVVREAQCRRVSDGFEKDGSFEEWSRMALALDALMVGLEISPWLCFPER